MRTVSQLQLSLSRSPPQLPWTHAVPGHLRRPSAHHPLLWLLFAVTAAKHGGRLVLKGDEGSLATTAEEAQSCAAGEATAVAVVGLNFAACDEAAVGAAVEAAWRCFGDGGLDALVNCSYEGVQVWSRKET